MQDKKTGQQNGSQMRITLEERALIKSVFKNNEELLKLLRKVFLPEVDPKAPLGQIIDLWMTVDIKDKSPEEAIIELKARNTLISHVDQQLLMLQFLANIEDETPEEALMRMKKDSVK